MRPGFLRPVLIRFTEMMVLCISFSSICCALFYYQIIVNSDFSFCLALFLAISVFVLANTFMLRRFYLEYPVLKVYYILNYIAYGIFMFTTAVVYILFGEVIYAWMFSTLKITAFMKVDHTTVQATAFSHFIMLLLIAIAPLDLYFSFKNERDAILNK